MKKRLHAKIIIPLRYLDQVENLFPVRKKTREIRLGVDFINLNKASLKYSYPLPKMNYIMHKVAGFS